MEESYIELISNVLLKGIVDTENYRYSVRNMGESTYVIERIDAKYVNTPKEWLDFNWEKIAELKVTNNI